MTRLFESTILLNYSSQQVVYDRIMFSFSNPLSSLLRGESIIIFLEVGVSETQYQLKLPVEEVAVGGPVTLLKKGGDQHK